MIQQLIICVGISGSGKSTWTTDFIKDHRGSLRINRDSIRMALVGCMSDYYKSRDLNYRESLVTSIEASMFESIINRNPLNIIIDNTNLKQSYINGWIKASQETNLVVKFKIFDIDPDKAKLRVVYRDNKDIDVSYIDKQYEQFKQIKQYLETYHRNQII